MDQEISGAEKTQVKKYPSVGGKPLKDVLYVKTFGEFSITWNGKSVTGGAKSRESQFVYLMQMLLHNRENGVSRDTLEAVLFEDRDLNNLHHAMQSVVYNAKKKLRQAGLPEDNYIQLRKGIFYWTDTIPVIEDATEFEHLYSEAEDARDMNAKLSLYLEACHSYTGEFLPAQASVLWVAREARRYRELFCTCVESTVPLLRATQDYLRMEELGFFAARVHPLADWEIVTMEALMSLGRYEDAQKLYEDTVEYYFREQGLRPSPRLMEMLQRLGEQMEHRYAVLDEIQADLTDKGHSAEKSGGYMCSYPVFQGIYRMVERMMERGGQSVYLMLCTVVDSKGNPMREGPVLDELSQRLGDAIRHSVRHSDAINRYGKGQYLVLLVNTTLENCQIIQKRINAEFVIRRQRTGIQYYVSSVICPQGGSGGYRLIPGKDE